MGNLCPDKKAVFAEAARVLRPGGRLAIADIITEQALTDAIVCNADLWASCIGAAAQQDLYVQAIESSGSTVHAATSDRGVFGSPNPYTVFPDSRSREDSLVKSWATGRGMTHSTRVSIGALHS